MLITKARFRDFNTFGDVQTASYGSVIWSKSRILAKMLTGNTFYLIRDSRSGELQGFATIIYKHKDVRFANLAVKKEYQSSKIGHKFFVWLIAESTRKNKETISFHTSVVNKAALKLGEHFDFKSVSVLHNYYKEGYMNGDAVKMVRVLGHREQS